MGMQAAKRAIDIGIVVNDIRASLAFYVGVLGLSKLEDMPVPFGVLHRLAFGDSFVKLIDPKNTPPKGTIGLEKCLGFRYLTFQVSNIDEICDKCRNNGVEFTIEKKELIPGVTIAMVKDPDDNIVEFVQRS